MLNVRTATELVRRWRGLRQDLLNKARLLKAPYHILRVAHAWELAANELEALYLPKENRQ